MITHTPLAAGNLPIKTLVARQGWFIWRGGVGRMGLHDVIWGGNDTKYIAESEELKGGNLSLGWEISYSLY